MHRRDREEILEKLKPHFGTQALDEELARLPEKQQEYALSLYGLDGQTPATAKEIAEIYGVSESVVNQGAESALSKLSHPGVQSRLTEK